MLGLLLRRATFGVGKVQAPLVSPGALPLATTKPVPMHSWFSKWMPFASGFTVLQLARSGWMPC
jgi:hypothetical protein